MNAKQSADIALGMVIVNFPFISAVYAMLAAVGKNMFNESVTVHC